MGMDQNLLSQLHPILYRLLFKVAGFDRCPNSKSPGGPVSTPTQLQNCTSSIINYQFCRGDHFTHTHSFIGFDYLGIPGTKNTIAKESTTHGMVFGNLPLLAECSREGSAQWLIPQIEYEGIQKNMGMDQNLLSQLHPILYRLLFKVSDFDRCPNSKSPGGPVSTLQLNGYGSNLAPAQFQNFTS